MVFTFLAAGRHTYHRRGVDRIHDWNRGRRDARVVCRGSLSVNKKRHTWTVFEAHRTRHGEGMEAMLPLQLPDQMRGIMLLFYYKFQNWCKGVTQPFGGFFNNKVICVEETDCLPY